MVLALPVVLFYASGMRIGSASANSWLPEGWPERGRYERFLESFGSDQYLVASWEGCRVDDPRLAQFKERLRTLDVSSDRLIESLETTADLIAMLTGPPLSLSESAAIARLKGAAIGADGTAALFVRFSQRGIAEQKKAIAMVREAADGVSGLGNEKLHMVGSVYEAHAIDVAAEHSMKMLVVPSGVLGVTLAWICLHSIRAAAAVLLVAGFGQVAAVAIVTAMGIEFSAILIVLPTLVFMLTLSAAVHFMNYYADVAHSHSDRLGAKALLLGLKPSVLATLTTSLGMIALATSQLAPIRSFGFYSALCLCVASGVLILTFPQLSDWFCRSAYLARYGDKRHALDDMDLAAAATQGKDSSGVDLVAQGEALRTESAPEAWAVSYAAWMKRNAVWVTCGGLAFMLFSFYGLWHLKSSTSFKDMFPAGSPTLRSMEWFEGHLGPIASVEVILKFPRGLSEDLQQQALWVDRVAEHLREQPDVGGVMSATTFLPPIPRSGSILDVAARRLYRSGIVKNIDRLKDAGWVAQGDWETQWRLTAKISALSRLDYGELTDKISAAVREVRQGSTTGGGGGSQGSIATSSNGGDSNAVANVALAQGVGEAASPFEAEFTGLSPIMEETQSALLRDLGSSFISAFLLILPVMVVVGRGLRTGLLIMVPNVLPETVVFGGMAWLGYSIDIAGILTASVAMGIAVNDTLHFVNWYTRRLALGDTRQQAIADSFSNCAKAMVHTMLISCCSMLPFMLAQFNPTRQFAILMIAMMSTSILGDLVLLPALLLGPLGERRDAGDSSANAEAPEADAQAIGADAMHVATEPQDGQTLQPES